MVLRHSTRPHSPGAFRAPFGHLASEPLVTAGAILCWFQEATGTEEPADIGHADGNFDQLQADELGLAGGQLANPDLGEPGAIDPREGIDYRVDPSVNS